MKLYLKIDSNIACKKIIQEQLNKVQISYEYLGFAEIEVTDAISSKELSELNTSLSTYGIEIIENQKSIFVQKIKDTIIEMVYMENKPVTSNISYITDKLKQPYRYMSSVFSEVTYTSIENFIILQKIERGKQLIKTNALTITEIAYILNYSSVSHFCYQFKSVTGITPSAFQRIINKRNDNKKAQKQNIEVL